METNYEKAINSMSDTYLEEMMDAHPDHSDEDLDIINKILSYRTMTVPLKLNVKDHHYATVLRKTGTLPTEIMFNEKFVHIEQFVCTITIEGIDLPWLVVLTRAEKFEKRMGKANGMAPMTLKEIHDRYLDGESIYFGIVIYGAKEPYFVSIERIEKILGIESE